MIEAVHTFITSRQDPIYAAIAAHRQANNGFHDVLKEVVTDTFDPDPVKEASYGQHLGQGEMTLC